MAATLISASSSVVAHDETLIRIAPEFFELQGLAVRQSHH